jgi:hypothetical protein
MMDIFQEIFEPLERLENEKLQIRKVIKSGKVKRTQYVLLDRPLGDDFYKVIKISQNGAKKYIYMSSSIVNASCYFDNLFKEGTKNV